MSKADDLFIAMCRDIIEHGTTTLGQKVRPHWEDGTSAYTIKRFGICNRYDLRKEFPALTLRRTALRSAMDEILWIWQRKSNNIHDLKPHIWDEWADENGSIGKAYGYQMGVKHIYKEGLFDQVDRVLYDLKQDPFSRRIMTNLYVHQDLHEMNLYPCAYSMTFNVTKEVTDPAPGSPAALDRMPEADEKGERFVLNAVLNQRSNDVLTANNWNVAQYAILLMMVAQVSGMVPGELVHMIADAHIYDRHVPMIRELISRKPLEAPRVWLDPDVTDFYAFTTDSLHYENYETHEQIRNIPVAI
jgi:thymidylate synthase